MAKAVILLVDDINLFLEVERGYLQETDARIVTAQNGLEALDIIRSERPLLIFMDQRMPVMDGISCCRAIKGDPELKSIPVIMIIASDRESDQEECRNAGADDIITKPIDRRIFLETGRKYLPLINRREKRIPCTTTVVFRLNGAVFYSTGIDISEHGIFVAFDEPVRDNDSIQVNFVLPGSTSALIEASGRIAWSNSPSSCLNLSYPYGFGLEFTEIPEESSALIAEYIRKNL